VWDYQGGLSTEDTVTAEKRDESFCTFCAEHVWKFSINESFPKDNAVENLTKREMTFYCRIN